MSSVSASDNTSPTGNDSTGNSTLRCWICFGEDSDSTGVWVRPCRCSLVSHEECLLDWIAVNQEGSLTKPVQCPQCGSIYKVQENRNLILSVMGTVDKLVHTAVPYFCLLGIGCSVLVTSTTYGVFTVLTIFGIRGGERFLGRPSMWTWRTWLGLPFIPITLIATRARWSQHAFPFATLVFLNITGAISVSPSTPYTRFQWPPTPEVTIGILPWIRLFYNNIYEAAQRLITRRLDGNRDNQVTNQSPQNTATEDNIAARQGREPNVITERDIGVAVMDALLWPTVSRMTGSILGRVHLVRRYFPEPFHQNMLGGCLFIVAKDACNLFYKYQRVRQYRSRRVKNFSAK